MLTKGDQVFKSFNTTLFEQKILGDMSFKPIPSPVFPVGHRVDNPIYDEIEDGHIILRT